jgi:predicted aspartyl protease
VKRTAVALLAAFCALAAVSRPAGAAGVVVPMHLIDNRPFVPVTVNGRRYEFVVDTGGDYAISTQVAGELGLHPKAAGSVGGANATAVATGDAVVTRLAVGPITVRDVHVSVIDFAPLVAHIGFRRFDGIIGYTFLRTHAVTFDAQRGTLTFDAPPPAQEANHAVSFRLSENLLVVRAAVDGTDGDFILDTGDRSAITLFTPFAREHYRSRGSDTLRDVVTGFGLTAPIVADVTRLRDLALAGYDVADPIARLATQQAGGFASAEVAGSIGYAVLRRFVVTFDYPHGLVRLSDPVDAPRLEWDRSGMWLSRAGANLRVDGVVAGGPAAEAGLQDGDLVLAVDGVPAAGVDLPALRERLTRPQTSDVRVEIRRGLWERGAIVRLRTLV